MKEISDLKVISSDLGIGAHDVRIASHSHFNGLIDDLRIYNRVLKHVDLNTNGKVNIQDLSIVGTNFGMERYPN